MNNLKKSVPLILSIVALLLGAISLVTSLSQPQPIFTGEAQGISHFTNLSAGDLTLTDDLFVTDDAYVTGTLTANMTGDITGNSTGTHTGATDLNGNALTLDADADTTLIASYDDNITVTIPLTTGAMNVLTGNLVIGNGTPGTALNGEDLYVEGYCEVDGELQVDGVIDANNGLRVDGALARIGNVGDPGILATGASDLYIEDAFEVNGQSLFQSAVTMSSTLAFNGTSYPIAYGSSGYAFDLGTATVTDTLALALSNVTTPTIGLCTLAEDVATTESLCTVSVSGITATLKLWNIDASTAGASGTQVHWLVVGQE